MLLAVVKPTSNFVLLVVTFLSVSAIAACSPHSQKTIRFEDVYHGQTIGNMPYTVSLTVQKTALPEGRFLTERSLSLTHAQTGKTVMVSDGMHFDDTPQGRMCHNCLATVTQHETQYIVSNRYGGGSGGFYAHDVFELTAEDALDRGYFISCGRVVHFADAIVLPSAEVKCSELFFSAENDTAVTETFSFSQR